MSLALAIFGAWLAAATVYRWLAVRALDTYVDPGEREPDLVPPDGEVLALRPLHGAQPWLARCLDSLWRAADRARTRVVLGVADPADPAVAVVRGAMARSERPPTELRIGPGPRGLNRKVANLIQMTEGTQAEILLFSDADVLVPEDYVDRAIAPFKDTSVGLVTFPYRSVPGRTLASRIDALTTNLHFLPGVAMALRLQGLHFALGASIGVRREALERAGGLESLLEVCGDDYEMSRIVEQAGYRLAFVPVMLEHLVGDVGWRRAAARHLRWARVVRSQRPPGYLGQAVTHGSAPALVFGALVAASGAGLLGALVPAAYWGLQVAAFWRRRRLLGLRRSDLPLVPVADLAAFLVWAGGYFGRPRPS